MPDVPSYRTEPDAGFADRLEVALLERLPDASTAFNDATTPFDEAPVDETPVVTTLHEIDVAPSRMSAKRRNRRIGGTAAALAIAASAVVGIVVARDSDPEGPADGTTVRPVPVDRFAGDWAARDADGSSMSLEIRASTAGGYQILYRDEAGSVCAGAPATMTGSGQIASDGVLLIPQPVLTCDDGSTPTAVNGGPLQEQLVNTYYMYDSVHGSLIDSATRWWRQGAQLSTTASQAMWPQTNLADVFEAQRLADAGDPDYTWQVDRELALGEDQRAEIFGRFLREQFGWEAYHCCFEINYGGEGVYPGLVFVRCAPDTTNPLYPNDERGRACAPTIDGFSYETVRLNAWQLDRLGATGLWVVTDWEQIAPVTQVVPPSEAERAALLEAFLGARVAGQGAEQYLAADQSAEIPLLYATSTGSRYERFEFTLDGGPYWPDGSEISFTVELFADGGQTVVEQGFVMTPDDAGRLELYFYHPARRPTTENGQPIEQPYTFLDGRVTFAARYPWIQGSNDDNPLTTTRLFSQELGVESNVVVFADPVPVGSGCRTGAVEADAEELVRTLRSNPDFEVTEPVPVPIGGVEALMFDMAPVAAPSDCEDEDAPRVFTSWSQWPPERMRVYVLDLPGASAQTLAIVVYGSPASFERTLEAAAPVIDSFEFHQE